MKEGDIIICKTTIMYDNEQFITKGKNYRVLNCLYGKIIIRDNSGNLKKVEKKN